MATLLLDLCFPVISNLFHLLAPQSERSERGFFYFRQRLICDCDYGVCGDCNAFDLVTVRQLGWLLQCWYMGYICHGSFT